MVVVAVVMVDMLLCCGLLHRRVAKRAGCKKKVS
jgi:hypothetical protein